MQKTEIVCGLPWLQSKPERAIFLELGYSCVYVVGPSQGRPVRIHWAKQLPEKIAELQPGCWKPLSLHDVAWTVGDKLAIRLLRDTTTILDGAKRRLEGDWFDVTAELAQQTLRIASEKGGIPTFTHADMLGRVRAERQRRLNLAAKHA
jgi:hypothetical protein